MLQRLILEVKDVWPNSSNLITGMCWLVNLASPLPKADIDFSADLKLLDTDVKQHEIHN